MDEIAYNTRKMVDYLEMAAGDGGEDSDGSDEPLESVVERAVGKKGTGIDPKVQNKLRSIEDQNRALIDSLSNLSSQLNKMGDKPAEQEKKEE
ncbi:MAG: hypothetical protein GOV00_00795 [Candidatus Altiarchaeota archaeon]|nr:hypothetical protein [Candidatus Altiarchaeota archaeon]